MGMKRIFSEEYEEMCVQREGRLDKQEVGVDGAKKGNIKL